VTGEAPASQEQRAQNRKDAGAAGVYLAGRSVGMALVVVASVAASHLYDQLGFAYVSAIIIVCETANALGSLGLHDAIFYFFGRHPDRAAAIVRQTSALLLMASIPVMLVMCGVVLGFFHGTLDLVPALPWLALVIMIELPTLPAINQLIAHGHAGIASALYVTFAVLRTVPVLVPAATGWSLSTIPVMMALFGLTRLVTHLAILRRVYPLAPGQRWWRRDQLREIFLFALPAGLAATVGKLTPQIDKYAALWLLGPLVFGIYNVAAFELPLVTLIPYAIGAVMQVRYVRLYASGDVAGLQRLWYQTTAKTMVLVVPLAVAVIALAPDLIALLFEPSYQRATLPFQILTVVLLHRVAAYGPMLQATNQTRLLFTTSLLIVGSNLLLQAPMTWLFGFTGPALATAMSVVPSWLFTLHRIGVALGGGIRIALPWRFYARTVTVAGALGAALALARAHLHLAPAVSLVVGLAGYAVAFVIVGRLVGLVTGEDTAYVRRALSFGLLR
jgi:O-antigen/teichoic acid export membrane protein